MLTFNGSKFNSEKFVDSIMGNVTSMAKEEIAERFRSMRHPETGEFPTVVVYGDDISDMSMKICLLYTSPSPRDGLLSRMPSSA